MASAPRFRVQPSSGVPIFRQLVEQVHALAAAGTLRPGDTLPSTRELSAALSVNPMTISRAWSELERQGVLVRVRGVGMRLAAPSAAEPLAARKAALAVLLRPVLHRAHQLGLTPAQVRAVLEAELKEADAA